MENRITNRNADCPIEVDLETPTQEQIGSLLCLEIAKILGSQVSEIDAERSFDAYGLSSLDGLILLGVLEDRLGVNIPPTAFADHQTLSKFTDYLLELTSNPTPPTE